MPGDTRRKIMIQTPTVGRKVWYRPCAGDTSGSFHMYVAPDQPLDATVIAVWGDRLVSLLVTDITGKQFPVLSCTLVQDGDPLPPNGRYCEWMPYQKAQHAATATPAPVAAAAAPATTIEGDDFPLGKACDLSGDGTCESCT